MKINENLYESLRLVQNSGKNPKTAKSIETFEKRSILFKAKEGENFNHRNTLSILRIKI